MIYEVIFRQMHPDFFRQEYIRNLPKDQVFEEQVLDLHEFDPAAVEIACPEHITFGLYSGKVDALQSAVAMVDQDWVQYFTGDSEIYCAFDGDTVVSFCLLDDMLRYDGLRVAGPGCVGTVPAYRKQGIGLKMVQKATALLKERGYDLSYIHYTHVGHWYARLGYQTVLRWNADGLIL